MSYVEFLHDIGNRLRALRKAHGMTQREFADSIEASTSAYGHDENGWHVMNIWTLRKRCERYGVSADELLGLELGDDR